jgi:regulator of sigma E protease
MTWLIVGLGIVLIIFVHELGHFSVAMAVKLRPRSFYVFFPPALVKTKRNGIEYGIGMIPLGGLVRIPGMNRPSGRDLSAYTDLAVREHPELAPSAGAVRRALDAENYTAARRAYAELEREIAAADLSPGARRSAERGLRDVEEGTAPDAYWRAATWRRIAVIAAGPAANVLLAFVILFVAFTVSGAPSQRPTATVANVETGTPAAAAGLQVGDRIVAVDGRPTRTFSQVSHLIRSSHGAAVTLTVLRDGQRVKVGPRHTIHDQGRWILGFSPSAKLQKYPVGKAASAASSELWSVVTRTGSGLTGLFSHQGRSRLSGPVGLVRVEHSELQIGLAYYLEILAVVSMSIALINLLPVLPLDGGHILFSLIEAVRRRPLAREVYERVSVAGIALLLLIYVIAFSNDLSGHGPH